MKSPELQMGEALDGKKNCDGQPKESAGQISRHRTLLHQTGLFGDLIGPPRLFQLQNASKPSFPNHPLTWNDYPFFFFLASQLFSPDPSISPFTELPDPLSRARSAGSLGRSASPL